MNVLKQNEILQINAKKEEPGYCPDDASPKNPEEVALPNATHVRRILKRVYKGNLGQKKATDKIFNQLKKYSFASYLSRKYSLYGVYSQYQTVVLD